MQNITPDNLVAYIFADCSSVLKSNIYLAAQQSWELRQKVQAFRQSTEMFYQVQLLAPRLATQTKILHYAASKQNKLAV